MNEEKKRVVAILDADKSNSCDVYVLDKRKHFSTVQGKGTGQLPFDVMTNRLTFYTPSEQAVSKENLPTTSVIRENLTTEQASNYGEFAGVKYDLKSIITDKAEHYANTMYGDQSLIPTDEWTAAYDAYYTAVFENVDLLSTHTLNAVRGIIEATIDTSVDTYGKRYEEIVKEVCCDILTEINKLQP